MGYEHIENLAKSKKILNEKRLLVQEKVHGTSANVKFIAPKPEDGDKASWNVGFHSGGAVHTTFELLCKNLMAAGDVNYARIENTLFQAGLQVKSFTIYGEAFGGKILKMAHNYGRT